MVVTRILQLSQRNGKLLLKWQKWVNHPVMTIYSIKIFKSNILKTEKICKELNSKTTHFKCPITRYFTHETMK